MGLRSWFYLDLYVFYITLSFGVLHPPGSLVWIPVPLLSFFLTDPSEPKVVSRFFPDESGYPQELG